MIKIIIADDHALVRTGLRRLLDDIENITVLAEADNGHDAISHVNHFSPDVAILDINMPGLDGIKTTEILRRDHPLLKIIIVSMHSDELFPQRLIKAGANAYLTKDSGIQEIEYAINEVMANRNYICTEVAQKLALINTGSKSASPFKCLSKRELEVLGMMIKGLKVADISNKLCLSPKTVSTYRYRLFAKLSVDNDIELTKLAMQHGFIEETPLP
ncbi:MAG: response regulator [Gammaproteobacteria bacterium]|nr:response regulator [Gammaproteobacteria bacterium]